MAARCISPPESSRGLVLQAMAEADHVQADRVAVSHVLPLAAANSYSTPSAIISGASTFSSVVSSGSR